MSGRCIAAPSANLYTLTQDQTHQAETEDVPDRHGSGLGLRLIHDYLNYLFGMRIRPSNLFGRIIFLLIEPWRFNLNYYGGHLIGKKSC